MLKYFWGCREGKDTETSAMQIMLKHLNFNIWSFWLAGYGKILSLRS